MSTRCSNIVVCLIVFTLAIGGFLVAQEITQPRTGGPQNPERDDNTQLFMRAKLASSQRAMEGLVTENFLMIGSGAKQMKKISEAAHWPTTVDEVYQHHSVAFRMQCDKLVEQAERKDLEAAHYTYLQMTTTCIDCHNYVRGRFRIEKTNEGGPVQLIPTYWERSNMKNRTPLPDDDKNDSDT